MGWVSKSHPFLFLIYLYIEHKQKIMKPEYKIRAQENLEAITKRATMISEMLEGKRPANPAEAIKLSKEIERLVELTTNIVDLS
jgi:hypothetical protein